MNLNWLGLATVLPVAVALAVAWSVWKRRIRDETGSIAGSAVVLVFAVLHVAREWDDVLAARRSCTERPEQPQVAERP